ncbi:hypothetical protein BD408DRAFT_79415 [Parasitella parasitica]|nr:hypothetical protein BD408DRAFT_79415 [Parasitella parasitica]
MFVGDRGLGIGSRTKGFLRYGGHWKPKKNSLYSSILYTNEHNTSQTCPYCFRKLSHPLRVVRDNDQTQVKTVKGAFICVNKDCISVKSAHNTHNRDILSALAIGLAGVAQLVFGVTFPSFDPKTSFSRTDNFNKLADVFLNKKRI